MVLIKSSVNFEYYDPWDQFYKRHTDNLIIYVKSSLELHIAKAFKEMVRTLV